MLQPIRDQDSGYGELAEPPLSLWKLVEEQVPLSERAEIKRILGDAAVDLSLELHSEVEVLLDLWRDARATYSWSRPSSPCSLSSLLADPPVIKDMVTQEIRMLLLSVRQKARNEGLDESQALSKYSPKIVNYVMAESRPESRACSVLRQSHGTSSTCSMRSTSHELSRRPQTASMGLEGRPLSSLSTGSSIEDDLEELKDKLKISHIDKVITHLKSLLEEECRSLERDIAGLQQRLELEHLYATRPETPLLEPSLSELKEERRIIERDLQLQQSARNMTPKATKTRPSAISERTVSGNPVRLSITRSTSATATKISLSPSSCKLKIQEQKPSFGDVLPPSTLTQHNKVTEKTTSARGGESTDIRTSKGSHRAIKAHPIGNTSVLCPSNDLHKNTALVLNSTFGKDSLSNLVLYPGSPSTPELQVPLQGMDSVFVPSPPQIQRPVGSTSSSSSLRRARLQKSFSQS